MYLIVNTGSTSVKYRIFDSVLKEVGFGDYGGLKTVGDYKSSADKIFKAVFGKYDINTLGYRVVHGREFKSPYDLKSTTSIARLKPLNCLAPLHNPLSLIIINGLKKRFYRAEHFAVFDTSFFINLPEVAKIIPIDSTIPEHFSIHKYGFHGISHHYVATQTDKGNRHKIISFHLGAGSSVAAIDRGKPLDTSMSFTPSDGLIMQTRSGAIDPGLVIYLA